MHHLHKVNLVMVSDPFYSVRFYIYVHEGVCVVGIFVFLFGFCLCGFVCLVLLFGFVLIRVIIAS